jgi:hypothetical protein
MFHILALIMGGAWGVWLYMAAAAGALILEVVLLAARRSFSQPEGQG